MEGHGRGRDLAYKINRLFETKHPAGRREYTHQEVVDGIRGQGGPTISPVYLWQLRHGVRKNPSMEHLEALAQFFGVSPAYFFDDPASREYVEQLAIADALRDERISALVLRASGLSDETLGAILAIAGQARRVEGTQPPEEIDVPVEADEDPPTPSGQPR